MTPDYYSIGSNLAAVTKSFKHREPIDIMCQIDTYLYLIEVYITSLEWSPRNSNICMLKGFHRLYSDSGFEEHQLFSGNINVKRGMGYLKFHPPKPIENATALEFSITEEKEVPLPLPELVSA